MGLLKWNSKRHQNSSYNFGLSIMERILKMAVRLTKWNYGWQWFKKSSQKSLIGVSYW